MWPGIHGDGECLRWARLSWRAGARARDQRNDPYAEEFDRAVLMHGPELLRFARRLTLDYHRGEDVVQEVLARAAGSWSRIRSFDNVRAYLFKCVLNETLSWRRRRAAGELVNITLVDEIPEAGPSSGFEDQILQQDELRAALARLSAVQRAVVVLRYYQDLPDAEIADLLGCPTSTVRSHAARALSRLRTATTLEPSREGSRHE